MSKVVVIDHISHIHPGLFAVLILVAISISGCTRESDVIDPVTISFVYQDDKAEYYEPLVDEFMQLHPEITVEITEVVANNLEFYSQADVIGIDLFTFSQFKPQETFLDLTPLIEQDTNFHNSDFYPGTIELFSISDKIWAIPFGIDTFVLYYNKDLFDQSGFEYPTNDWTWDELLAAASAIRKQPDTYGYGVPDPYLELNAMILMYQHGGQLFDDLNYPSEITYNDPLNIEAMQWYQDLYFAYDVAPSPDQAAKTFGYGNQKIYRGVLQGDIGMWPGIFSDRGGLTWPVQWDHLSWGIVALPEDDNDLTSGFGEGYAISAQTQNPKAAWLWVAFLSEQVPQILIPARRSLAESKEFRERLGAESADAALESMQNVALISPDMIQFSESLDPFSQAIHRIVDGTVSAQEALNQLQDKVEGP